MSKGMPNAILGAGGRRSGGAMFGSVGRVLHEQDRRSVPMPPTSIDITSPIGGEHPAGRQGPKASVSDITVCILDRPGT